MDPNRFDAIARTLGTQRSRRTVLGALLAGGATAAVARVGLAAPPQGTVTICHYSADTGTYGPITVSTSAQSALLANGHDYVYGTIGTLATITVDATDPNPVDTGVSVADSSSVSVTVTGESGWYLGDSTTPPGGDGPCGYWGANGLPSLSCGSLVGAIGTDNDIWVDPGAFVEIGAGPATVTASGTSGDLVLQYVDGFSKDNYGDNAGALTATITGPRTC